MNSEYAEYRDVYKCRLCGEKYKKVGDITNKGIVAETAKKIALEINDGPTTMYDIHYCDNDSIGIADFQGFECTKLRSDKNG